MNLKNMTFAAFVLALAAGCCLGEKLPVSEHPSTDAYDGWRLGAQTWSFKSYTFFEAIDKAASLGLGWVEAYPSQKISKEYPSVKTSPDMPQEYRAIVKKKLAQSGVKLVNYGVIRLPNNEAKCREVFDFAKDMGIETIVSEPPEEAFEMIDRLCQEYKIKVAIHNHPRPSHYWNPDTVLAACKGRSEWIGACADTGHWVRSGLDPVEMIKKLKGRIISLHLKEIEDGHDVVWGTGANRVGATLAELYKQDFKGVFSIEYEYNWKNSVPEIRQCVNYFNGLAGQLNPTGWKELIDDKLSLWTFKPGSWQANDGVMELKGGSYIWSRDRFDDFILDLQFKVATKGNSGVFFRTSDLKDIVNTGIEVQIHDTDDGRHYGMCGAIYNCMPAKKNVMNRGQWNRMTLTARDNKIYVVMNGDQIIDMDLNDWTEPGKNPDGTKNKFKYAYKDMAREGHIGFQDHGNDVQFRNVKIKRLRD